MNLTSQHTAELTNLAAVSDRKSYAFEQSLLEAETRGDFWGLLESLGISLVVSREYEHFLLLLGTKDKAAAQSYMPLPHPSGMIYDREKKELILSSTRTPNLIFWLKLMRESDYDREVVPHDFPRPDGELFLPYRSVLLPGTLYIHEIAQIGGEIFANITGHNFLARLGDTGGWERVWWPKKLDALGDEAFKQNFFQLNSIAAGTSIETSYFSGFSDLLDGSKPWKLGYGPDRKGVIFSGQTRDVICRGLTCPHSVRIDGGDMWVCNSGYGEVGIVRDYAQHDAGKATFETRSRLPGFTRGLAFHGDYAFVGLSKVIEKYEPYAPGLKRGESQCGVYVIEKRTGNVVASVVWPSGYQIFDVQVMPEIKRPLFPVDDQGEGGMNQLLRYLG